MADSASASPSTSGTIKLKLKLGKSHYTAAVAQTPPVLSPVPVHQPAITLPSESNASSQPPAQPSISGNSDSTTQTPNAELTSAADDAEMVEHDEYRDEESVQDLLSLSTPTTHIVTSLDAQQTAEPVPHSSVGHIVLPPVAQNKKKKKPPASATPSTSDLNGNGKGWRKGLKGNQKPEGAFASTSTLQTKRKRNTGSLAEDDLANAEFGDPSDEYIPQMVAPGGLATSDKWANGLPGGNEQSRATAAMASAVNKAFPVGAPPKTGSGFLTAIPLDRRTPSVRKWTKTKREVVGPNGIAYLLPVWMGANESPYLEHMATHPRALPVAKVPTALTLAAEGSGDLSEYGAERSVEISTGGVPSASTSAPAKGRARPGTGAKSRQKKSASRGPATTLMQDRVHVPTVTL